MAGSNARSDAGSTAASEGSTSAGEDHDSGPRPYAAASYAAASSSGDASGDASSTRWAAALSDLGIPHASRSEEPLEESAAAQLIVGQARACGRVARRDCLLSGIIIADEEAVAADGEGAAAGREGAAAGREGLAAVGREGLAAAGEECESNQSTPVAQRREVSGMQSLPP